MYFYKNFLKHVISLYLNDKKIKKIKQDKWVQGLPLSNKNLQETRMKKKDRKADYLEN